MYCCRGARLVKKWILPFRLPFNLATLVLAIGLVAVLSDHATNNREQTIDRNLKAQQALPRHSTVSGQGIEQLPSLQQNQIEPRYQRRQVNQRFASQAPVTSAVVNY